MSSMVKSVLLCIVLPAILASPLASRAATKNLSNDVHSIEYLYDHYFAAYQLNDPSGSYVGSKSILGQNIQIQMTLDGKALSFAVTGAISVNCASEPYTYANSVVSITNVGKAGDCVHDALAKNSATLQSITYSPSSDELVATLKYSFLTITITLKHTAAYQHVKPLPATEGLSYVVHSYQAISALQDPAGTYYGGKSILGETIDATVVIESATSFKLSISGSVSISCDNEAYTYENGVVTVTHVNDPGDCIHDELSSNNIVFQSITYDTPTDSLTIKVKYSFLTITLELAHKGTTLNPVGIVSEPVMPLGQLIERYYPSYALNEPAGTYFGEKSVLGAKVDTTIQISGDSLAFTVSGVISITCSAEAFTYSDGVIMITDIGKAGDCVHDALSKNSCTLQSLTYDTASDEIVAKIKYSFITISLNLAHQSRAMVPRVAAPSALALPELFNLYYPIYAAAVPSGMYNGTKSILGVVVTCSVETESDSLFNIIITGPAAIDCKNEEYTYSNGVITVVNLAKSGDCLHDALQQNKVTFQSIDYDQSADHITIHVKFGFIAIALELDKVSA